MHSTLAGRSALITGGGTGIGRAVALDLAEQGARVAVLARTSIAAAEELVREIQTAGGDGIALAGDVRSVADCSSAVDRVLERFGSLDILVNNAGTTRDGLLVRMTDADWDDVLDTNLRGAFLLTRAALGPMLKAKRGKIVNITSVIGIIGNPGQANYAAAKAALTGFTRSVAREVAPSNIQVNAVAPGFIETRLTDVLSREHRAKLLERTPAGRFGKPTDVSGVVAFLCGDRADFITGQTVIVDGGMLA
jgi:3-oxoacyl-[acyl-carrier protein] reductase